MWATEIAVMLGMIGINGLLAGYEIALASVSVTRLQALVHEGARGSQAALSMKQNMEASFAVVQLGITLVGAVAGATGGAGAEEDIAPNLQSWLGVTPGVAKSLAIAAVVLPLTVVTIIFGELIPKVLAVRNTEAVCLRFSPAMKWLSYTFWPIVWMLESSVKTLIRWVEHLWKRGEGDDRSKDSQLQELKMSAYLARSSHLIGAQEERIITQAADLSHRPVREVMLPADFMSMLTASDRVADALISAHRDMHTRFPVTEQRGDPQAIVGYVNFKDMVAHLRFAPNEPTLQPIIRKIAEFPADETVARCLERLIRERSHIALVRDRSGQVLGMVTMEDMIEELVGSIEDEYDKLPQHMVATGRGWIVGGGVSLEHLRETTGIDLTADLPDLTGKEELELGEDGEVRLVNQWIMGHLNGPITGGEILERPGVRAVVRKSRRHKVMEAYLLSRINNGAASGNSTTSS